MFKIFSKLFGKKDRIKTKVEKPFDFCVVHLPESELGELDKHYPISNDNIRTRPALLVCIYNTRQLAREIGEYLKNDSK